MEIAAIEIIQKYYDSFNQKNWEVFFGLLCSNVIHEVNQGKVEKGKARFQSFMDKMNQSYDEMVTDLVLFSSKQNSRVAAEFNIQGKYLKTDEGLPEANGQTYQIRVGAFFEIENQKITRVTNYYNLNEWLSQVR